MFLLSETQCGDQGRKAGPGLISETVEFCHGQTLEGEWACFLSSNGQLGTGSFPYDSLMWKPGYLLLGIPSARVGRDDHGLYCRTLGDRNPR